MSYSIPNSESSGSQSLLSWMSPRASSRTSILSQSRTVSIPVVVDEPSGVDRFSDPFPSTNESQSLLSWMSPRAFRDHATSARIVVMVSIPVVVDEPSGAWSADHTHGSRGAVSIPVVVDEPSGASRGDSSRWSPSGLNPCCRG